MKINKIMSKTVVTVELDDSLREVQRIFDHTKFHHLLVIDDIDDKPVGIISWRDILKVLSE